nr:MAG TPA: hypothetical protein [Caudoviricetes sp.]
MTTHADTARKVLDEVFYPEFFPRRGVRFPDVPQHLLYLRLLPARESRHSHTATEGAKRCIFTRKGRAAHLVNR